VPRAMITSVLLLVSLEAANADLRIVSSGGGEVGSHLRLFAAIRQSGQRVIIRRALPVGLHTGAEHDPGWRARRKSPP